MRTSFPILILLLFSVGTALGQTSDEEEQIIETLKAFEEAIIGNDREAASELLSDEIRILEGNAMETKEEYLSHHFHADGKFLGAVNRTVENREVFTREDIAWSTTKSRLQGLYGDRDIKLTSLELAVLEKENDRWKITALHWSSSTGE